MKNIDRYTRGSGWRIMWRVEQFLREEHPVRDLRTKQIARLVGLTMAECELALGVMQRENRVEYVGGRGRGWWSLNDLPWYLRELGVRVKYPSREKIEEAFSRTRWRLARARQIALEKVPS